MAGGRALMTGYVCAYDFPPKLHRGLHIIVVAGFSALLNACGDQTRCVVRLECQALTKQALPSSHHPSTSARWKNRRGAAWFYPVFGIYLGHCRRSPSLPTLNATHTMA